MRALLACPACRGDLEWSDGEASCGCGASYGSVDGIPVLIAPGGPSEHNAAQAREHDFPPDPGLDARRLHGTPAFYGWLVGERMRRGTDGLDPPAPGGIAVTVCGGPGMDAEFLARHGWRVINVDVSHEASRRAAERARRHDLPILPVVAEAERLPLRDMSVELAFVLDGLHHLEDPFAGLSEMARVAQRAVSVNEPAAAGLTRLAVRAGAATDVDPGGSRVARLSPTDVRSHLEHRGFRTVRSERFAMHYEQEVGRVVRALSRPRLGGPARHALTIANRVAGGFGNKLSVRAVRPRGRDAAR